MQILIMWIIRRTKKTRTEGMENSSEIPNPVKLAVQAIVKNLSFFIKRTFQTQQEQVW